jgi:uncharacterized membrane protein
MNTTCTIDHFLQSPPGFLKNGARHCAAAIDLTRIILLFLALILAVPGARAQNYAPTDILVPDGDYFRADAMNDHAEIVGGYTAAGGLEQPVVWRKGVFTQLPLLPGGVSGWARGINNIGQMVGACAIQQTNGSSLSRACVWENGAYSYVVTAINVNGASSPFSNSVTVRPR